MELLLKYDGLYPPPAWERLGARRVGSRLWHFPDLEEERLAQFLGEIERHTDSRALAETLAAAVDGMENPASALLEAALPFTALVARVRQPWLLDAPGERLEMHYQPIVDLAGTGAVFAHEALCRLRSPGGELLAGAEAFALATRVGRECDLDLACQERVLALRGREPATLPLFLNVLPATLLHEDWLAHLLARMREHGVQREALVIEIVASERTDPVHLAERCEALREEGLRVALDDVGAGSNAVATLAMVRADFVRIDRSLVHEAQGSRVRAVLLEAIVSTAERLGGSVIAEGVERPEDLDLCHGFGIRYAQGHLFARPARERVAATLPQGRGAALRTRPQERFRLAELLDPGVTVDIHSPVATAREQLREMPHLPWLVVLDGAVPVGFAPRGRVLSPTTRSLAQACRPLRGMIAHDSTLSALARALCAGPAASEPWAVIGAGGAYLGLIEPMPLVAHLLTRKDEGPSRHPLSQLPTGPSLRQAIEARIARRDASLALVYIDLDHFKAFNDRYGFIRGDAMIRTLAEILRHVFPEGEGEDRLLGHIGGDDFILVLDRDEPQLVGRLERVTSQFQALASHLYDAADLDLGYFVTEDGQRHPIASISVACVNGATGPLRDSVAAAERAAWLKKLGKARWGSVVVIEADPPRIHAQDGNQALDDWKRNAVTTLEHLATLPRSRDPHALDQAFRIYPFFEMLFELDAAGVQRCPNWINPSMYGRIRTGGTGTDRSQQAYYRAVRDGGTPFVSPIYLSSASEDFCLTVAIPLADDRGHFGGVLVGDLSLSSMAALLDRAEAVPQPA